LDYKRIETKMNSNQSKTTNLQATLFGLVAGITCIIIFNELAWFTIAWKYRLYVVNCIIGACLGFYYEFLQNKSIDKANNSKVNINNKSLLYIGLGTILGFALGYLDRSVEVFYIIRFSLSHVLISIAFIILFIHLNLKDLFHYKKFHSSHYAQIPSNEIDGITKLDIHFPNHCLYCKNESILPYEIKLTRQTNVWGWIFTKSKKMLPISLPYCKSHHDENKKLRNIMLYSYIITFIIFFLHIIISANSNNNFSSETVLYVILIHFVALFVSFGIKLVLIPFFPSISGIPLITLGFGYVGHSLAIGIRVNWKQWYLTLKFQNPELKTEIEDLNRLKPLK
jgi:hypothetical protein